MAIQVINVSFALYDQNGLGIVGAKISAILSKPDVDDTYGVIVPELVSVETDSAGNAVMSLWPNTLGTESTKYLFEVQHNGVVFSLGDRVIPHDRGANLDFRDL